MNRELYIHTLSQFRDECKRKHMDTETEAFNAAIQALSADGDCISRQAAIDLWDKYHHTIAVDAMEYDRELRSLPSAQPEIIQCGECSHKDKKIDYCHYLGITICERDYCSYAERRTDGFD